MNYFWLVYQAAPIMQRLSNTGEAAGTAKCFQVLRMPAASATIGRVLKPGDIVIYESTVYPGATEEDCVPVLEHHSGLVYNRDFYAGYSPERINPGDKAHRVATIKKVTEDIRDRFNFNTAISSIMELVNEMYHYKEQDAVNENQFRQAILNLLLVMAPFTPHVCEELWEQLGMEDSIHKMGWPKYDEAALVKDTIEIVVQINGKIKDKIMVPAALTPKELETRALENEKIKTLVAGMTVVKVIAVPGKLVNIVVKP